MFGRRDEIDAATRALRDGGLTTLTGPGGIGKTRVALACAARVELSGARRVHVADLSAVDAAGVPAAIARAVGAAAPGPADPVEQAAAMLGDGAHLLVLDTFEHVLDAREWVVALLDRCPRLAVLVTSRVRLRVAGERDLAIGPLPVDRDGPAVALFRDIAQPVAAYLPDAETTSAICRAVDGSPLAIRLVAARTALLPAEAILRWVSGDDGRAVLDLLGRGGADLAERHQSVRAVALSSYELLGDDARRLWQLLGVFRGPMRLDDIEGACGPDLLGGPVIDALGELVDLHLVELLPPASVTPWYRLLDPLREFAIEQAAADGAQDGLRRRHAEWYVALAAAGGDADDPLWRDVFEHASADLLAAIDWLERHDELELALRLTVDLGPMWLHRGPMRQGRALLDRLLHAEPPPADPPLVALATAWWCRLRAEDGEVDVVEQLRAARTQLADATGAEPRRTVDEHLAHVLLLEGQYRQAAAVAEPMRARAARQGDREGEATALVLLSRAAQQEGRSEPAVQYARDALAIAERGGRRRLAARAEQALAELAAAHRDVRDALLDTLAAYEAVDDRRGVVLACVNLGAATHDRDGRAAARWYCRALTEARAIGYHNGEAFAVTGIAALAAACGRERDAATLHGALLSAAPGASQIIPRHAWEAYRAVIARARSTLGTAAFAQAMASAPSTWARTIETAQALGHELCEPVAPVSPLTPRELEVLGHLASGATNRQIAEALVLSPKTVMHHTSSIFRKLDVRGRAEAVDAGHRLGLLAPDAARS
jgi:predicted ATPase/DNA-binding CsgD family transcriptional regulator